MFMDMDEDRQLRSGIFDRFRRDIRRRLAFVHYAVWTAVSIILLATVALSAAVWQSSAVLADRPAGIGAIFAGMTLFLTLFAAVVAYGHSRFQYAFPSSRCRSASGLHAGFVHELPVLNLTGLRTIPGWAGRLELAPGPRSRLPGRLRRHSAPDGPPGPVMVISIQDEMSRIAAHLPVDFIVNGNSQFPPAKELPDWL
jgi:hypothetical protein